MTMVTEGEQGQDVPERWSAKAKTEVVLRLLRGEGRGGGESRDPGAGA